MNNHKELIEIEFSGQAEHFDKPGLTLSKQELLDWIVTNLDLRPEHHVLDVAAGTCLLSRNIAPHVAKVTALDATAAMLERGGREIAAAGIENIETRLGDAAQMPFDDKSFDLVVSRLALHHFQDCQIPFAEMVRVAKPGGRIGVADLLSPENPAYKKMYNHLERLRDPSHVMALDQDEILDLMHKHGLEVRSQDTLDVEVDFERWLAMASGGKIPGNREALLQALKEEMQGGETTGMRPCMRDGRLIFLQTWGVFTARK